MDTLISHSPEETCALGEAWGRAASRGLVIGLTGELGAGKTQLVKGLARGLGITRRVTSPSFALVNEYREGRLPLFHLDLYRLDTPEQILGAGLEPYLFEPDGVAVVEWIERWTGGEGQGLRSNVQGLRSNVQGLRSNVQGLRSNVQGLMSKVQGLRSNVQGLRSNVQGPPGRYRRVVIEAVSETERRICYEDIGV